jgi:hypothetical protein
MAVGMVIRHLNDMLVSGSPNHNHAKAAVQGASTVAAAVEASGVYVLAPHQAPEARAVFHALAAQPAVDQEIRTALQNAFAAGKSVSVAWAPLNNWVMTVNVNDTGNPVIITLHCQPGNLYPAPPLTP